jgi:hypothetical protein
MPRPCYRSIYSHAHAHSVAGALATAPGMRSFVAVNANSTLDFYPIPLNQPWSPLSLKQVSSVKSIHEGNGIIIGRTGEAVLLDVRRTLIAQTLAHDDGEVVFAIAVRLYFWRPVSHSNKPCVISAIRTWLAKNFRLLLSPRGSSSFGTQRIC